MHSWRYIKLAVASTALTLTIFNITGNEVFGQTQKSDILPKASIQPQGNNTLKNNIKNNIKQNTNNKPKVKKKPFVQKIDAQLLSRIDNRMESLRDSSQRWIQVNLKKQTLTAWEGNNLVYSARISSGRKQDPTLLGTFRIQLKKELTRMKGEDYDRENVPHAMFYDGNYAIHGAYWHKAFGTPVSRGCVNLSPNKAKWLYNWASVGTPVVVHR
jgi:lipoprotein-anchoring transpeptidase ErfK/SrfK